MVAPVPRSVAAQAAVLALTLAAGVARVFTSSPDTASLRDLGTVVRAAHAASTMRVVFVVNARTGGVPSTLTGNGAVDFAHGTSSFAIRGDAGKESTVISDGTTTWTRLPPDMLATYGGKHWVASPAGGGQLHPENTLDALASLTGLTARADGHATVGGFRTIRYTARTALRDVAARLRDWPGALFAAGTGILGDGTATFGIYVDGSGLPRRLDIAMRLRSWTEDIRFDYYDYGRPVGVAPPPASDVAAAKTPP